MRPKSKTLPPGFGVATGYAYVDIEDHEHGGKHISIPQDKSFDHHRVISAPENIYPMPVGDCIPCAPQGLFGGSRYARYSRLCADRLEETSKMASRAILLDPKSQDNACESS